jgi:S-adenosylmethionine:tRNA ribosyltransferase-isomerase
MLTSDFDYHLPSELIAQTPIEPRDHSRLMIINRETKAVENRHFFDIVEYFKPGDVLVWNNSKVFKARLHGRILLDEETDNLEKTTGKDSPYSDVIRNAPVVEIFLVRPMENRGVWKVLAKPGKKLRLGMKVVFAEDFIGEVVAKELDGTVLVQFADDDMIVREKANKYGEVPLPPYVEKSESSEQTSKENNYQTVYAKHEGSVAAPTAGFHFTSELIEKLKTKGVEFAEVTLHVGLGTFLPVKSDKVEEHQMHSEWVELTDKNADIINRAKAEGRRVVAVGTTTVRTLEGIAQLQSKVKSQKSKESPLERGRGVFKSIQPYSGDLNIFITPGFEFKIIDALITNFHLPKSTLIMLVSAFVENREFTLECYKKAVKEKYRFYSFGDAMLIF